jgi:hypothetical protein
VPRAALTRYSLRSRFGRRLLLLFILCSLIPMAALAVLSFGTVTRQLRQASLGRLEHTSRRWHPRSPRGCVSSRATSARSPDRLGVPCRRSTGTVRPAMGRCCTDSPPWPSCLIPARQSSSLARWSGLRTWQRSEAGPRARSCRGSRPDHRQPSDHLPGTPARGEAGHSGLLIGEVFSDYLWGAPERNPLIPTMQLHVVDEANQMLFGSIPGAAGLPEPVRHKLRRREVGNLRMGTGRCSLSGGLRPDRQPPGIANLHWILAAERGPGGG